jgi:hypothetical protein
MAKVLSPVWSIIRGSIAGTTYTANKYGSIIARQRVAPTNPGTNPQQIVRAAFTNALTKWRQQSDAVREAWNAYANTCTFEGPTGNYKIPGREMFVRTFTVVFWLNAELSEGLTLTYGAPTTPGLLSMVTLPVTAPASIATGYRINAGNNNGEDCILYAARSMAFNSTRNTYHGKFVNSTLDSVEIIDGAAGEIEYIGLVEDRVYFNRMRFISADPPYRLSQESTVRAVASTTVA